MPENPVVSERVETENTPAPSSYFVTADHPRYEDYSRCIHCGLCLNSCPTYRVLGEEMDSPRGRIFQVAQADAGRLPLGPEFVTHMDRCLDCRACVTACPSGVEYGKILERARAELHVQAERGWLERRLRDWFFRRLLPNPRALARQARLLRFYQQSGLRSLVRSTGLLRVLGLARTEALAPEIAPGPFFEEEIGRVFPAEGERRARVAFLAGCMQSVMMAGMNRATVRVLQKNGCEVVIPAGQGCCGALHVHAGLRDQARHLARTNIAVMERLEVDAVISNTAGCGSTLKEYTDLLEGDPEWEPRAQAFVARMKDINEFLADLGLRTEGLGAIRSRATYQDPCHLAHGQGIRTAPRQLLAAIPGLELREMERADQCCGSAGIYNVLQPEIADALLEDRMNVAGATGADLIVTANPGCMLQLQAGVRQRGTGQIVLHVVELLDEAYRLGAGK